MAYSSFFTKNKSEENILAPTDTEIISIPKATLENLIQTIT